MHQANASLVLPQAQGSVDRSVIAKDGVGGRARTAVSRAAMSAELLCGAVVKASGTSPSRLNGA